MSAIQENKRRFHIIIDAFNCDNGIISDKNRIEQIIRATAKLCGMTIIHGPVVLEGVPENPGVTGFAIIDFSHISVHTFTAEREICVDIFSCKPFNHEKVREYLKENFGLEDKYMKYIQVRYPELTS